MKKAKVQSINVHDTHYVQYLQITLFCIQASKVDHDPQQEVHTVYNICMCVNIIILTLCRHRLIIVGM